MTEPIETPIADLGDLSLRQLARLHADTLDGHGRVLDRLTQPEPTISGYNPQRLDDETPP